MCRRILPVVGALVMVGLAAGSGAAIAPPADVATVDTGVETAAASSSMSASITPTIMGALQTASTQTSTEHQQGPHATVETLQLDATFVGVVHDPDPVSVHATGVRTADGPVADGELTITIAEEPFTVPVTDGTVEATIDPTQVPDATAAGTATVSVTAITPDDGDPIDAAAIDADTATVELVHQVAVVTDTPTTIATPLALADDVATSFNVTDPADPIESASLVRYTADARLGSTYETGVLGLDGAQQVHEGFIVQLEGAVDRERIGLRYAENAPDAVGIQTLDPGTHLLGAAPNDRTAVSDYEATVMEDLNDSLSAAEVDAVVPATGATGGDTTITATDPYWATTERPTERVVFSPAFRTTVPDGVEPHA